MEATQLSHMPKLLPNDKVRQQHALKKIQYLLFCKGKTGVTLMESTRTTPVTFYRP